MPSVKTTMRSPSPSCRISVGYGSRAASSSTPMAGSVTSSGRSTPPARTRNGVGCPAVASCSRPVRGVSWPKSTVTKRSMSRVEVRLLQQPVAKLLQRFAGARRPGQLAAVYGGAQHELGDERGGHGVHALAGDVADGEGEAARGRPRVVVDEVAAAEHAGAGRAVGEGDVEAGEFRRRGRQQAPLQALGHIGQRREGVVLPGAAGRGHRRRGAEDQSSERPARRARRGRRPGRRPGAGRARPRARRTRPPTAARPAAHAR